MSDTLELELQKYISWRDKISDDDIRNIMLLFLEFDAIRYQATDYGRRNQIRDDIPDIIEFIRSNDDETLDDNATLIAKG